MFQSPILCGPSVRELQATETGSKLTRKFWSWTITGLEREPCKVLCGLALRHPGYTISLQLGERRKELGTPRR